MQWSQLCVNPTNIIHVPGMRNNLISLRQWDAVGGCYTGENNKIILTMKTRTQIAHGTKIKNHLYKMDVTI